MIHYPLGYDVKANCVPSPHSADLCEPRLVTALSRSERGPEGVIALGVTRAAGAAFRVASPALPFSLQPNIYTSTAFNIDEDFLCV